MAHYEDLTIDQGTDVVIKLECYNPDGTEKYLNSYDSDLNSLIPLYEVNAKIKKTYNTKDSDSITFDATTLDVEANNVVSLSLTNLQTDEMKPGRYVYDVELKSYDSDNDVYVVERILEGKLTLTPSVTR